MMSEEIKKEQAAVRSFRVTDDVMSRFREIQSEMDLTQDAALKMLVDAYELEQAKNAIPDRETEISNFQLKANELVEAFLYSLQINQDAEARIRAEVALQLESKDKIIQELQERVEAQKELAVAANTAAMEAENKQKQAEEAEKTAKERAQAAEKTAADKTAIAEMLQGKLTEAEAKLTEYPNLKSENEERAKKIEVLQQELKETIRDMEIEKERALSQAEAEKVKVMNEAEKEKAKVKADKEQALAAAELTAERALAALEREKNTENQKLRDKIDNLKDERADLKENNAKLQAEIEMLQAQVAALTPVKE